MKAIILARVSSKEQEEGQSIPAQQRRLIEYAEKKKLDVIETLELTESSCKGNRTKFFKIIDTIKKSKQPIALVIDTVDRLQRNFKETGILDDLRLSGKLELHFLREGLIVNKDSNSSHIIRWNLGVFVANSYVLQLADNIKRSREQCSRNGQWTSKAPFGYKNVRDPGGKAHIVKDETEALYVEKIFDTYLTGNHSYRTIADEMYASGMRSDSGGEISHTKIEDILKNAFYCGCMKVKGETYKHIHPIIISEAKFDKAQAMIEAHGRVPFQYAASPLLFRGLITCKNCGCAVSGYTKKNKYVYYNCSNSKRICKKVLVREEDLLTSVLKNFESIQLPGKLIEEIVKHMKKVFASEQDFVKHSQQNLQTELNQTQSRISKLIDLQLDGKIDQESYQLKLTEYKKRQHEIFIEMQAHADADESCLNTVKDILDLAKQAKELFESSNMEEKRQLLRLVHSNFLLDSGKLHWELAEPFATFAEIRNCSEWWR